MRELEIRREEGIDRALASTRRRVSGRGSDASPIDPADEVLLEQRRLLVESMQGSVARVPASRDRMEVRIENLRLQLTRLRSGVGDSEDVMRDLVAAGALIATAERSAAIVKRNYQTIPAARRTSPIRPRPTTIRRARSC